MKTVLRTCVPFVIVTMSACGRHDDAGIIDGGTDDSGPSIDASATIDGATIDSATPDAADPLGFLTDGASTALSGYCTVSWERSVGTGTACAYESIPTYSGTAAPLAATLVTVRNVDGWVAQMRDVESTVLSPQPLAVSFPGPNVSWHADIDLPLMVDGQGRARASRLWMGPCVGVCGGPLPSQTGYTVTLDPGSREAIYSVGGYLPTMPHPNGLCWSHEASLSCRFTGTF